MARWRVDYQGKKLVHLGMVEATRIARLSTKPQSCSTSLRGYHLSEKEAANKSPEPLGGPTWRASHMDENEVARVARDVLKRVVAGPAKGDRYYDRLGRLLTTPQEILECLAREHKVKVKTIEQSNAAGGKFNAR